MNPPDTIPDFLVQELEQLDEPALLAVALHAESDGVPPDRVPEDVSMAFAMQDDETIAEIGKYARKLANSKDQEDDESTTPPDTDPEVDAEAAPEESEDVLDEQNQGLFRDGW
jgi:hypothetical protein